MLANTHSVPKQRPHGGFTLIELIMVIVLLGIVSVTTFSFVRFGFDAYLDAAARQSMSGVGRFVVERLSRELRNAVPASVQVRTLGGNNCLEFRPAEGVFAYLPLRQGASLEQAPIAPLPAASKINVMPDNNFAYDSSEANYVAVVYPQSPAHAYGGSDRAVAIQSNGYRDNGDGSQAFTLTQPFAFAEESPARRLYVTSRVVTFCHMTGQLFRFETDAPFTTAPNPNHGVLMGQRFNNLNAQPMFSLSQSSFSEEALVQLRLVLAGRATEQVELNHEIHLLQAP